MATFKEDYLQHINNLRQQLATITDYRDLERFNQSVNLGYPPCPTTPRRGDGELPEDYVQRLVAYDTEYKYYEECKAQKAAFLQDIEDKEDTLLKATVFIIIPETHHAAFEPLWDYLNTEVFYELGCGEIALRLVSLIKDLIENER